ncbi:hypothetical protein F2P45_25025 [Massilia sp. CCM 8733]|uniref:Uncharacterized protein n=1 Tax=Massilia mucilaginosa TaxID=2609282 RepID=A0ABX0NZ02_9BURK|nr:hypothetical protein [Massilia mucilaginosa]NHZ92241.1 hypothetical protein [Massilia mucilaginosa]
MQTLIQVIETVWSGASRGAPGAVARNAVPERVPAPDCALDDALLLHLVPFHESEQFAMGRAAPVVRFAQQHQERFPLAVAVDGAGAHIDFFGYVAQRRPKKAVSSVLLEPNNWVRIVANFRVAQEEAWVYHKLVFNIFHGLAYRANELMASKAPLARIDLQVHLW